MEMQSEVMRARPQSFLASRAASAPPGSCLKPRISGIPHTPTHKVGIHPDQDLQGIPAHNMVEKVMEQGIPTLAVYNDHLGDF